MTDQYEVEAERRAEGKPSIPRSAPDSESAESIEWSWEAHRGAFLLHKGRMLLQATVPSHMPPVLNALESQVATLQAEKELELGHAHEDYIHVNQDEYAALQSALDAFQKVADPERLTIDLLIDWKSSHETQEASRLTYLAEYKKFKTALDAAEKKAARFQALVNVAEPIVRMAVHLKLLTENMHGAAEAWMVEEESLRYEDRALSHPSTAGEESTQ